MTVAWIRGWTCVALLAPASVWSAGCSLNPQPLPPGDKPDSSVAAGSGADAGPMGFGAADAGGAGLDGPTGNVPDGSGLASPDGAANPGPPDGGDGGPVDGAQDGSGDGPEDARTEASMDAQEAAE
jgi:hypothetical protein